MNSLPESGSSFGRYEIRDRIGRGGMGVVLGATHRELRRDVAIKLLSPEYADDEAYRHRFLREAQALARLDSPYVTKVHDAGEQDGWLFIATELISGGDLKEYLKSRGPLPRGVAVALVRDVAAGLQAAHSAGILHRDIKPSNVLLRTQPDNSLQPVLCDLGIAADIGSEYTKTSGVIGTLGYMAPERHEGSDATVAADVYALGCLLWACLSGDAPYTGTDFQVMSGHVSGPIPQLTDGSSPDGWALNGVLRRSMAKDPRARFSSASEMMSALDAVPVSRPLPPPYTPPLAETMLRVVDEATVIGGPATPAIENAVPPNTSAAPSVIQRRGVRRPLAIAGSVFVVVFLGVVAAAVAVWPHRHAQPAASSPATVQVTSVGGYGQVVFTVTPPSGSTAEVSSDGSTWSDLSGASTSVKAGDGAEVTILARSVASSGLVGPTVRAMGRGLIFPKPVYTVLGVPGGVQFTLSQPLPGDLHVQKSDAPGVDPWYDVSDRSFVSAGPPGSLQAWYFRAVAPNGVTAAWRNWSQYYSRVSGP